MKGIVWLASYPKSGNTWFRAFLANLLHGGEQPVDINAFDTNNFAARPGFDRALGWETSDLTLAEVERAANFVSRWFSAANWRFCSTCCRKDSLASPNLVCA